MNIGYSDWQINEEMWYNKIRFISETTFYRIKKKKTCILSMKGDCLGLYHAYPNTVMKKKA